MQSPYSTPVRRQSTSASQEHEILQLYGEISRNFDKLSDHPLADRLCEDTLSMTSSVESKLKILIYLAAQDDWHWRSEGRKYVRPGSGGVVPCLATNLIFCGLCTRAIQDMPRGSMPMLLDTLSSIVDCAEYPLLAIPSVHEPLNRLIQVAVCYQSVHVNCYEEDSAVYNHYLERINHSLAGLLLTIWKKISKDHVLLNAFVRPSGNGQEKGEECAIDILLALFHLIEQPATFATALQALLLACSTQSSRVLEHFSDKHDLVRYWTCSLLSKLYDTQEVLKEQVIYLCKLPFHLQAFLSSDVSSIRLDPRSSPSVPNEMAREHGLSAHSEVSSSSSDAAAEQRLSPEVVATVHGYLRSLVLLGSLHATLSSKNTISLFRSDDDERYLRHITPGWAASAHCGQSFHDEFLVPLIDMVLDCVLNEELVASYSLLTLLLTSLCGCGGAMASSVHIFADAADSSTVGFGAGGSHWNATNESLLSMTLGMLHSSMILDLAWGRLGSTSVPVAMAATTFLTTVMKVSPPIAGLSFLVGIQVKDREKGRDGDGSGGKDVRHPAVCFEANKANGENAARNGWERKGNDELSDEAPAQRLARLISLGSRGRDSRLKTLVHDKSLSAHSQEGTFSSNLHALYESCLYNISCHRLVNPSHKSITAIVHKYSNAISKDVIALLMREGDGLLTKPVEYFDGFQAVHFCAQASNGSSQAMPQHASRGGAFLDRLFRRLMVFSSLHIQEQIVLSGLLQRAVVALSVVMILASETVAKNYLLILQQVLLELAQIRTVMTNDLQFKDEHRNRMAAEELFNFFFEEGVDITQQEKLRALRDSPTQTESPPPPPPPAQPAPSPSFLSSPTTLLFSFFSSPKTKSHPPPPPVPTPQPPPSSSPSSFIFQSPISGDVPKLKAFHTCGADKRLILGLVILDEIYSETLSSLIAVQKLRAVFRGESFLHRMLLSNAMPDTSLAGELDEGFDLHLDIGPLSPLSTRAEQGLLARKRSGGEGAQLSANSYFLPSQLHCSWENVEEVFQEEFDKELRGLRALMRSGEESLRDDTPYEETSPS